jgi:hypothetical protein
MGPMTAPADLQPWRCPRCDADRAAVDDFCGRCGARRPRADTVPTGVDGAPGEASGGAPERDGRFPVRRALVLNGIILGAVLLAVAFSSNGRPGTIAFQPAEWRCDGTERAWTAPIPAQASEVRIEWRDGGPEGEVRASSTTTRAALEPYLTLDGSFRVTTTDTTAPECGLDAGEYTMTVRDALSNGLLASGTVVLAP